MKKLDNSIITELVWRPKTGHKEGIEKVNKRVIYNLV